MQLQLYLLMVSQHLMIKDVSCVRKAFNLDSTYRLSVCLWLRNV